MRKTEEDPNLADVKAVLQRLQRLDLSTPEAAEAVPANPRNRPGPAKAQPNLQVFDRKLANVTAQEAPPRAKKGGGLGIFVAIVGALALAGVGGAIYMGFADVASLSAPPKPKVANPPVAAAAPQLSPEDEIHLITDARRLLGEGNVIAARQLLQKPGASENADVAFVLAQSFDPNYVRTLPKPNAPADRAQAERWYTKWYEIASHKGLEMDSGRLKRIIKAMQ